MTDLPDGYYWVTHIAGSCGDTVRVLVKDGKITWWPSQCRNGCLGVIHGPEDLDLSTAEAE